MKKVLLLCATIMCLFGCTEDEAPIFGGIYGVVSDSASGEPIYNASVTLSPTNKTIVTGREGHFEFTNLEAGQYSIKISADGYEGNSTPITVIPGEKVSCDIQLSKKSVSDLFTLSTENLNFGSTQTQMSVEIKNNSSQNAEWHLDLGDENLWIKASPISGRLAAGSTASIRFTCNRTTVTKDRSGIVNITISGDDRPITVSCSPSEQVSSQMEISPLDIDFGSESLEQIIRIKNKGQANLNWTLSGLEGKPLTASDNEGEIQPGNGQDIDLILDRSKISSDFVTSFTISDGTNEQQINVYASADDENNMVTLSTNELNFGADKSSLTLTVTAGNIGAEVGWKSSLDDSPLTSSPSTAKISPNSAKAFTINLDRTKFSGVLETAYSLYIDYDGDGEQTLGVKVLATNTEDEAPESNKIYYTTNNGVAAQFHADNFTTSVKSHTYDNGQGVIIFNDPLTSIGEYAFQECENITSITLPNSITEIQAYAFSECSALKSISLPDGLTTLDEGVFDYCISLESISLPSSLKTIGFGVFSECASLSSITLPEGLEAMGSNTFSHCTNLVTATIPSSIKEMGNYIFSGCTSLVKVELPATLTAIPSSMFKNCSALTRISLPESITSVGSGAFEGCVALTSLAIPNNVTSIGGNAFRGCSALTDLTLPEQLTSISKGLFYGCSSLTSIVMPDNVTEINPEELFEGCTSLQEVILPQNITEIPDRLFSGCSTLTSITIPDSVTSMGWGIFEGCTSLQEINLPQNITELPYDLFSGCSALKSITIPDSVTSIGNDYYYSGIFEGCTSLEEVIFSKNITELHRDLFEHCRASLKKVILPEKLTEIPDYLFEGCEALTSVTIPGNETSIHEGAFYNCKALEEIILPENLTYIPGALFSGCSALKSITIPDSVTSIGDSAFSSCTALEEIILPQNLTSIRENSFHGCSALTSITIPEKVTQIGYSAFALCTSLTEIRFLSTTPPDISENSFSSLLENNGKIYVPEGAYEAYAKPDNDYYYNEWNNYAHLIVNPDEGDIEGFTPDAMPNNQIWYISSDRAVIEPNYSTAFGNATIQSNVYEGGKGVITFDQDVTTIGAQAFSNITNLVRIIIPKSITSIKEKAFSATKLSSIIIPESVTSLSNNAFEGCNSLSAFYGKYASADNRSLVVDGVLEIFARANITSYSIPEGVTAISDNVFAQTSLTSVTLPSTLETIGNYAFYHVPITEITLPAELTSIGEYAFRNTSITKITSNATNLTMVGKQAFNSCHSLESATFNSIKAIGEGAFGSCSNLKSITLPDTETIAENAFQYTGLPEISLPKTLQSIGRFAFGGSSLQKVTMIAGPTYEDATFKDCSNLSEAIIEEGITYIPENTFYNSGIKKITIPNSVTEIQYAAFWECDQLKEISIPGTIQTIGNGAFYECSNLLSVTLNEGIKTIGSNAFTGCAMYTVTLPKSLESLGYYSFSECTNLTEVYSPSETPLSMVDSWGDPITFKAFQGFASGFTIYVPTDSVEAYKTAWSSYADYITAYDFSAE